MSRGRQVDDRAELTHFVRVTLGCGCPDEIVAQTVVDQVEGRGCGLDVGGRLLVRLLPSDDLDTLVDEFPATVRRLRDERDKIEPIIKSWEGRES